jgi:glycerol-1-phosphatase
VSSPAPSRSVRGVALGGSPAPLCEEYDAALLDLDGVLYLGSEGVPHAAASVAAARSAGMRVAYVTNNASRAPVAVAAHLCELGIPAETDDVVTSGQAAVRMVAERVPPGASVLVLGSDALSELTRSAGLRPVRTVAAAAPSPVAAVVQGLSPTTAWTDLAEASVALRAGALWVTGNLDTTLPTPRGPLPGNGSLVAALRTATGREPLVAGKPEPALHQESVSRVGARRPLVVGDRLDTDVLGAVRGGADSLLVLTGVVDAPAVLRAPAGSRPTYVASDLRGLLVRHPEAEVDGDRCRVGEAVASLEDGVLVVRGQGDDALRAACALAWASSDAGRPIERTTGLPSG